MTRWQRAARSRRIVWLGVRMALAVALLERRRERMDEAAFERLSERVLRREAVRLREAALELQGLLIKLGQFLSTRVDILPASFTHELAGLRDLVPAVSWPQARALIEDELGRPPEAVFAEIAPQPVASASLGQAHRAVLADGQVVAVKVQRPGVEQLVDVDLEAVRTVVRWVRRFTSIDRRVDLLALYGELERTTREELDYRLEADHAERFAANFAAQHDIVVPAVHRQWSTRRVLVLEFVEGRPIDDREGIAADGTPPAEVAERLVRTYLQQVLRDGFFHADPHPGNVFVAGDGRLVYLDFGMMGKIVPHDRAALGAFVRGVIQRDLDAIIAAMRDLGFLRPHADSQTLRRALGIALDRLAGVPVNRPSSSEFEDFLEDMREFLHTEPFQLPTQYTFLGRAAGILLGIVTALDPDIDLVGLLRQHALRYLGGEPDTDGEPATGAPGGIAGSGIEWSTVRREALAMASLLYRFPHRIDRLLERVETGDVRFKVDLGTVARRMDERSRVLDRLVRALLTCTGAAVSTWLLTTGHVGDARAGWLATALLLFWTLRGGSRRGV